ncbi:putative ATP synthase subunit f, mitochondrial [Galendromus occidentalis]|uniref:ATP synthase subunit f, mitochondrial n=1 Tax=Galendromus occidentalis TaxID=34638 RepID=A0AAJ6VXP9_9ACAR|nr:putative ATP synthase subunit f, mitochondrial [Galendromus occidentalis]
MGFGDYPLEYNRNVHGPYDPSRYYGKPDTKFSDLKLSEIPAWIGRRNKSPQAAASMISRAYWRWQIKYLLPRRATPAPYYQFIVGSMLLFYYINHHRLAEHTRYKYH